MIIMGVIGIVIIGLLFGKSKHFDVMLNLCCNFTGVKICLDSVFSMYMFTKVDTCCKGFFLYFKNF